LAHNGMTETQDRQADGSHEFSPTHTSHRKAPVQ
jgi:hypothetical protein